PTGFVLLPYTTLFRSIVRVEDEMRRALDGLEALRQRAARAGVGGHREYNPGWHAALDLSNLLLVSEAVTRAAIERRESRGGHFRDRKSTRLNSSHQII